MRVVQASHLTRVTLRVQVRPAPQDSPQLQLLPASGPNAIGVLPGLRYVVGVNVTHKATGARGRAQFVFVTGKQQQQPKQLSCLGRCFVVVSSALGNSPIFVFYPDVCFCPRRCFGRAGSAPRFGSQQAPLQLSPPDASGFGMSTLFTLSAPGWFDLSAPPLM